MSIDLQRMRQIEFAIGLNDRLTAQPDRQTVRMRGPSAEPGPPPKADPKAKPKK